MIKKNMLGLALAAVSLSAPVTLAPNLFAQAISVNGGAIQGTITDPSGAAVSGAQISISSPETGYKKDLTTDKSGLYSVGPLNPGRYSVSVTAAGFQQLTVDTVIRTGTATPGSFKLSVGASNTEVTVSAGDVQVNTDQGGVADVITKQQIDSLPINGRNFLDIAQIEPGVILQSGESFDPTKAGYSAISVSGVSGRTTRILLDGQDITDETVGTTIFNVSQGSIQEFQLNRSTQDVSGEVTSTGQVLVATTSGTNAIHGQAFYNFQDHRALFARAQNGQDPQFQRNQFGGSVGGPIIKDKLFFFGNSERIKQDSSAVSPVTTGSGGLFTAIQQANPLIGTPYRETYSVVRLDYNGPKGVHFFARANYNVNAITSNFGDGYWLYANRDNTPGIAGGADFATGKFTHSFRGSYEKFHNLISDQTNGNTSIYNGLPASAVGGDGVTFYYSAQHLYSGPNYLAPQGTFQSDKQFRYDGSWSRGRHNLRYGYSINRILGGGFASFFGLSPRVSISSASLLTGVVSENNPLGFGCNNVVGGPTCPNDPLNGYHANGLITGNGQGYFTEKNGFNLPGGGVEDWRQGAYVQDSWKITPNFTFNAGVRWSVDTDRANQDLLLPTCGEVDLNSVSASPCGAGTTANTPLLSLFDSRFTQTHVHQPYANFSPQVSFVYALPGNGKTVLRGGIGLFVEGDVFNNTTNARTNFIRQGAFFNDAALCNAYGAFTFSYADGTNVTSVNGTDINTVCNSSLGSSAKNIVALQQQYQATTAQNAIGPNGGFIGETLTNNGGSGGSVGGYAPIYRTPYSEQFNFGIQHELFKGAVISADYVHNASIHVAQAVDVNHIGAARFLNVAAAQAAIAATAGRYAACAGASSTQAQVSCAIGQGAVLATFAGQGLDSGNQYNSGYAAAYTGKRVAAFAGANPGLGNGEFLLPIGRSGYDALQVVFHQVAQHPAPGIASANIQVSYSLSRIVSSSGGGSDQFFSAGSWDNDDPTRYIGRAGLDHKNEINFGGSLNLKYGPRVGLIGHFYSAAPTTLTLDNTVATGGIFTSDITGDGTAGDLAPGTNPGNYMHRITPGNLGSYIASFNNTYAGQLTPAGQALVSAGLFTPTQLAQIGANIKQVSQLPQASALANPAFRTFDISFSYPIPLAKYREGLSLEPAIVFYNVANLANFNNDNSGVLLNTASAGGTTNDQTGYLTGLNNYEAVNSNRVQRGSGTFNQGGARSTEFQLKLNF